MNVIEYLLPIATLLFNFLLKILVDRVVSFPDVIEALIELPNDIALQSTVFIVAFTISPIGDPQRGLLWFIVYIGILAGVIFMRRRASKSHSRNLRKLRRSLVWTCTGLVLSLLLLLNSFWLILGRVI